LIHWGTCIGNAGKLSENFSALQNYRLPPSNAGFEFFREGHLHKNPVQIISVKGPISCGYLLPYSSQQVSLQRSEY
jgi:hypothetical protein